MQEVTIIPNADLNPPLKGVPKEKTVHIKDGIKIARLMGGTTAGRSTIAIVAELPDGKHVMIELTMRNFVITAEIFKQLDQQASQ